MMGDLDGARAHLDDLVVRHPDREKRSVAWKAAISSWAHTATFAAHRAAAEFLIPELEPYAGSFVFTGAGVMEPMDSSLGSHSALCGRFDDSDRWFASAQELSLRAGWKNHQASNELQWAAALAMRPHDPDAVALALTLLDSAESIAHESGAAAFLRLAADVRATLASAAA